MDINKVSVNLGIAMFSRLITAFLAVVIVGLMTRYLGSSGYGEYTTIMAFLFMFSILSDFGLYTIMTREISYEGARESYVASNIFTLRFVLVAVLVILAILISRFLPYSASVKTGIIIAGLFTVFSSLSQILGSVYQKYLRFYYISISDIFTRFIQLAIVYFAVTRGLGFLVFIWAVVISSGIHFFIIFLISQRYIKIKPRINFSFWKKILKIALPVAASIIFTLVYFRLDTVMLSLMKPAADVGIYGVSVKVLEFAIFFPAMYVGLIMPLLSRFAKSDKESFSRVFKKTYDYLAILMVPLVVYLFILSESIVKIIGGNEFLISSQPLKFLALAVGFIFFGSLGGQSIVALNLQRFGMWAYLSGAVLNFSTNLIFIPIFSFNGAAATTLLTEFLVVFILFYIIKKKAGYQAKFKVIKRTLITGLIMALVIYPIRGQNIIFPLILGAMVYWPLLYLFKGYSKEDVKEFFKKRVPGVEEHLMS